MPEVVYPKKGNWEDVFPILTDEKNALDNAVVNQILYSIAMNNRFGKMSPKELKADIAKQIRDNTEKFLSDMTDPEERRNMFAQFGAYCFYLDKVFANLGGAYREMKR
jgi:hypothetical protein